MILTDPILFLIGSVGLVLVLYQNSKKADGEYNVDTGEIKINVKDKNKKVFYHEKGHKLLHESFIGGFIESNPMIFIFLTLFALAFEYNFVALIFIGFYLLTDATEEIFCDVYSYYKRKEVKIK